MTKKAPLKKKAFKKRSVKPRITFKKQVMKVVDSMAEHKIAVYYPYTTPFAPIPQDIANAANATAFQSNIIPLTPYTNYLTIPQGTGEMNRTGNEVRVVKAQLKMCFHPKPQNATYNVEPQPQDVMVWILKLKGISTSVTDIKAKILTDFLNLGNTNIGLTGTTSDYFYEINKDLYQVYYQRKIKLGLSYYAAAGVTPGYEYYSNNDYKLSQTINIDLLKHGYPKKLMFNDTSTSPDQNPLYVVISPCDSDGGSNASTTGALPCTVDFLNMIHYTDV